MPGELTALRAPSKVVRLASTEREQRPRETQQSRTPAWTSHTRPGGQLAAWHVWPVLEEQEQRSLQSEVSREEFACAQKGARLQWCGGLKKQTQPVNPLDPCRVTLQ